ncbi:MAG: pyruvate kinase [Anaerolineaceae bacterium]
MNRYAKIVGTLGPSSQDEATIRNLIQAGLDVARLNFSHGTHADHADRIALLRKLSDQLGKPITILQDLQGPKIRIGNLSNGSVQITAGQIVYLNPLDIGEGLPEKAAPGSIGLPIDFPQLAKSVKPGSHILLDDGHLEMEVTRVLGEIVEARVTLGGKLSSHKGFNVPGAHLDIPGFTDKDRADLEFGLQQGVDAVAISFVRTADDVDEVRNAIRQFAPERSDTPIIAKLERPEALENLDEILRHTDGVMVARGDLGVEMSPSTVPIAQKEIIRAANHHGRMVVTATQMLDSMIVNPRPTRAEASDVANAIFDGTDAVMLSGETASGNYPIEAVKIMDSIVREAEAHITEWGHCSSNILEPLENDAVSITLAARELAQDRNVAAIAVFTQTGRTAILMSKARPIVPILAFTPELRVYQRMGMIWGVTPFLIPFSSSVETMLAHVEQAILTATDIHAGQQIVLITGFPVGEMRLPNFALLHTIGKPI